MTVKIIGDNKPVLQQNSVIFRALDDDGALEVWVTPTHWEELWLLSPEPSTDEDRLDFALGMVEVEAANLMPQQTANGTRLVFVG